jgi:Uma2 family endonuclease
MSQPAVRHPPLSVEEYLRLEETSPVRHEYVAGEIHALAGASRRHNRIALNIASRLLAVARGGPCQVHMETVKVRVSEDLFYYPDVVVACGEAGSNPHVVESPCLVVEVTSPSTETTDRREKLMAYRQMPMLEAYLIVDQDMRRVERHFRDEEDRWWRVEISGEGEVPVPCPEASLSLDEIYEDVGPT